MKHRQFVETRLAQLGVPMSEDEVRQLGDAYALLVEWQSVVNTMLQVAYAYQQAAGFHLHHPDV